ncbi:Diatom spindle kinesin-1 [Diplonema papillatum]|nr:Diatom spindle kinesin-1 [Diplonema papillatum]
MGGAESVIRNTDKRTSRKEHADTFIEAVHRFRDKHGHSGGDNTVHLDESRGPGIRVCVRKRPLFPHERKEKEYDVITVPRGNGNGSYVSIHDARMEADMIKMYMNHHTFRFDGVFSERCTNEDVYVAVAKKMIKASAKGKQSTIMMYGQTGSGKTYTMSAIQERAFPDLFKEIEATGGRGKTVVSVTFVELAGDKCCDMLNGGTQTNLTSSHDGGIYPHPCVEVQVRSAEELTALVSHANSLRATAATGVHDRSSRSHAICRIFINRLQDGPDGATSTEGQLTLVDLAGTEHRIDSEEHNAERRKEGAMINASLAALKDCIRANAQGASFVSYRNNRLTQILRSCFSDSGEHSTVIMATVSPSCKDTEHSLNTLRHACVMDGQGTGQTSGSSHIVGGKVVKENLGQVDVSGIAKKRHIEKKKAKAANGGHAPPPPPAPLKQAPAHQSKQSTLVGRQQLDKKGLSSMPNHLSSALLAARNPEALHDNPYQRKRILGTTAGPPPPTVKKGAKKKLGSSRKAAGSTVKKVPFTVDAPADQYEEPDSPVHEEMPVRPGGSGRTSVRASHDRFEDETPQFRRTNSGLAGAESPRHGHSAKRVPSAQGPPSRGNGHSDRGQFTSTSRTPASPDNGMYHAEHEDGYNVRERERASQDMSPHHHAELSSSGRMARIASVRQASVSPSCRIPPPLPRTGPLYNPSVQGEGTPASYSPGASPTSQGLSSSNSNMRGTYARPPPTFYESEHPHDRERVSHGGHNHPSPQNSHPVYSAPRPQHPQHSPSHHYPQQHPQHQPQHSQQYEHQQQQQQQYDPHYGHYQQQQQQQRHPSVESHTCNAGGGDRPMATPQAADPRSFPGAAAAGRSPQHQHQHQQHQHQHQQHQHQQQQQDQRKSGSRGGALEPPRATNGDEVDEILWTQKCDALRLWEAFQARGKGARDWRKNDLRLVSAHILPDLPPHIQRPQALTWQSPDMALEELDDIVRQLNSHHEGNHHHQDSRHHNQDGHHHHAAAADRAEPPPNVNWRNDAAKQKRERLIQERQEALASRVNRQQGEEPSEAQLHDELQMLEQRLLEEGGSISNAAQYGIRRQIELKRARLRQERRTKPDPPMPPEKAMRRRSDEHSHEGRYAHPDDSSYNYQRTSSGRTSTGHGHAHAHGPGHSHAPHPDAHDMHEPLGGAPSASASRARGKRRYSPNGVQIPLGSTHNQHPQYDQPPVSYHTEHDAYNAPAHHHPQQHPHHHPQTQHNPHFQQPQHHARYPQHDAPHRTHSPEYEYDSLSSTQKLRLQHQAGSAQQPKYGRRVNRNAPSVAPASTFGAAAAPWGNYYTEGDDPEQ